VQSNMKRFPADVRTKSTECLKASGSLPSEARNIVAVASSTTQETSAPYSGAAVRRGMQFVPKPALLTLQMPLQDLTEHEAEAVTQAPFFARRSDFRARACGNISSACVFVVCEHVPGAFVDGIRAERGDGGEGAGLCGGFKTDTVNAEKFSELSAGKRELEFSYGV
jgi:hypothetical protein